MCLFLFKIIYISLVRGELLYDYKAMRRLIGETPDGRMAFFDSSDHGQVVGFTNPSKDLIAREMVVFVDTQEHPREFPTLSAIDEEPFSDLLAAADRFFDVHDEIVPLQELRERLIDQ